MRTAFCSALNWYEAFSSKLTEREHRHYFRMSRVSFAALHNLIAGSEYLQSNGRKPMVGTRRQLGICLFRIGSMTSIICIADAFKVSHGVVVAITERVCRAIIECLIVFTSWPEPSERISLSARFQEMTGFDGIVGVIDGTHIPFLQRPNTEDADAMHTYKRRYAIVVQGVADCDMRIRTYFIMSTALSMMPLFTPEARSTSLLLLFWEGRIFARRCCISMWPANAHVLFWSFDVF